MLRERARFAGIFIGLVGLIGWCFLITNNTPPFMSKLTFFTKAIKAMPLEDYILPLSFLLYGVSAFMRRRVSMIALGVLSCLMCGYYYKNLGFQGINFLSLYGLERNDLVFLTMIAILALIFPLLIGKSLFKK